MEKYNLVNINLFNRNHKYYIIVNKNHNGYDDELNQILDFLNDEHVKKFDYSINFDEPYTPSDFYQNNLFPYVTFNINLRWHFRCADLYCDRCIEIIEPYLDDYPYTNIPYYISVDFCYDILNIIETKFTTQQKIIIKLTYSDNIENDLQKLSKYKDNILFVIHDNNCYYLDGNFISIKKDFIEDYYRNLLDGKPIKSSRKIV